MFAIELLLIGALAQDSMIARCGLQPAPPRDAEVLVEALRAAPTSYERPATVPGNGPCVDEKELRVEEIYDQLFALGDRAHPAMLKALRDPDRRLRENVMLAIARAGFPVGRERLRPDMRWAVDALISAIADEDERVRNEAVITLGGIGRDAAAAIPAIRAARERIDDVGFRRLCDGSIQQIETQ
jgi:hypothetical protein